MLNVLIALDKHKSQILDCFHSSFVCLSMAEYQYSIKTYCIKCLHTKKTLIPCFQTNQQLHRNYCHRSFPNISPIRKKAPLKTSETEIHISCSIFFPPHPPPHRCTCTRPPLCTHTSAATESPWCS